MLMATVIFFIILCIHGVIRWYIHGKADGKRYPSIINVDIHLLYVEYIYQIYLFLRVGGWLGNIYPSIIQIYKHLCTYIYVEYICQIYLSLLLTGI